MGKFLEDLLNDRTVYLTLAIIIALGIFLFSSVPGNNVPESESLSLIPIVYHFFAFFIFSFTILKYVDDKRPQYVLVVLAIVLSYSLLDEVHQFFVPFRNPSLFDIGIDSLGMLFSTGIYLIKKT